MEVQLYSATRDYIPTFFDYYQAKGAPFFIKDIDGPEIARNPRIDSFIICPNCGNKVAIEVPNYILDELDWDF